MFPATADGDRSTGFHPNTHRVARIRPGLPHPARPGASPACPRAVSRRRARDLRLRVRADSVATDPAAVLLDQGQHGGDPARVGVHVVDGGQHGAGGGVRPDQADRAGGALGAASPGEHHAVGGLPKLGGQIDDGRCPVDLGVSGAGAAGQHDDRTDRERQRRWP